MKVFGGGPGFSLKLMSAKMEDQRSVWDIMPFQKKPVIQFIFSGRSKKNHTTNVGLVKMIYARVILVIFIIVRKYHIDFILTTSTGCY